MALNCTLMSDIFKRYRDVRMFNDTRSLSDKLDYQAKRLREIILFAFEHSAFYRGKLEPYHSRLGCIDFESLRTIPVTTRDELARNHSMNLTRSLTRSDIICRSSGTTGTPLAYALSRETYWNERAVLFWGWSRAGWTPGDRVGFLDNVGLGGPLMKMKNALRHMHTESMYDLVATTVPDILQRFRRFRVRWLRTVPSAMCDLIRIARESGIHEWGIDSLRGVFSTGEMLFPFQQEAIQSFWGVPVFDQYGAGDGGFGGFQFAPHSVYVADMTRSYAEIDEDGCLVVTSLDNTLFPFIRYRVGDIAKIRCSQDLQSVVLDEIVGRTFDCIWLKSGRKIHALYFTHLLNDIPGILRFRVVQSHVDKLTFHLQVGLGTEKSEIVRAIQARLDPDIRRQMDTGFEFTDTFPRMRRKFLYVERKF